PRSSTLFPYTTLFRSAVSSTVWSVLTLSACPIGWPQPSSVVGGPVAAPYTCMFQPPVSERIVSVLPVTGLPASTIKPTPGLPTRSEEHTSELQSPDHL